MWTMKTGGAYQRSKNAGKTNHLKRMCRIRLPGNLGAQQTYKHSRQVYGGMNGELRGVLTKLQRENERCKEVLAGAELKNAMRKDLCERSLCTRSAVAGI